MSSASSCGSGLVEFRKLVDFFGERFSSPPEGIDKDALVKTIEDFERPLSSTDEENEQLKQFLQWVRGHHLLKVSDLEVDSKIVAAKYNCVLKDIRVVTRGPDDAVFDSNPAIRAKIARGNSILETTVNGKKSYDLIIYALRKFTGGLGDEDETDRSKNDWVKYFIRDIEQTKQVLCLRKANGEAAHLSCRWLDGDFLICAGSKNVHLVFRNKNDIEANYTAQRFDYAKKIALAVDAHLRSLNEELRNMFLSFLCWTRLTVVLEILIPESQHVENLSYLKEPLLTFITFTESRIYESPTSLCCMLPSHAIEIAKVFQLTCVEYKTIEFGQVENHISDVRKGYGYEGEVIYFVDEYRNVIGILKKKTVWYIVLRAIREKLRTYMSPRNSYTINQLQHKLEGRLKAIQAWIGFTDDDLQKWTDLSMKVSTWFDKEYRANKIVSDDIASRFPVLWAKCLEELSLSDKVEISIQKEIAEMKNDSSNDVDALSKDFKDL